jgi:outer membrane lipoprotein LolB
MISRARFSNWRGGLVIALAVGLSACATAPIQSPATAFKQHQQDLLAIDAWQVEGKIGLRENGRGSSAAVSWQQQQDHYSLRLSGPLGIGTVLVDGSDAGVEVHSKDGVFAAATPEALLAELTGWHIPITALRYWARGLPAPGMPVVGQKVDAGRIASLQQGGWQIDYESFTVVDGLWLPAKMRMTRPETRLTLLYKHWQLNPAP